MTTTFRFLGGSDEELYRPPEQLADFLPTKQNVVVTLSSRLENEQGCNKKLLGVPKGE